MISRPKDIVTTCPYCGKYTLEIHMTANTNLGHTYGNCTYCHHQPGVSYQNDSFETRIIRIDR